jgi:Fe-S cluster biogenesis protein NfuA
MADPPAAGTAAMAPGGLDDGAVEQRLSHLDGLLGQLERIPGRTAGLALDAVEALVEVYGEALRRVIDRVCGSPQLLAAFTGDELLRHLLLLHGLHPDPVEQRVRRAIDDARRQLRARDDQIELVAVTAGNATVRLPQGSCGSCGDQETVQAVVRDEVAAAAPELADVVFLNAARAPALIPVTEVRRRPGPGQPTDATARRQAR